MEQTYLPFMNITNFLLALCFASLCSCVAIDPSLGYGGGYQDGGGYRPQPPHDNDRGEDFGPRSHQKGYQLGRRDGMERRSENHARHRGEYNPRFESSFCTGYHEGYVAGLRESPAYDHHDHDDHGGGGSSYFGGPAKWYESGRALGRRDRREGNSCNYRRHRNHFDNRTADEFARGYMDGYR